MQIYDKQGRRQNKIFTRAWAQSRSARGAEARRAWKEKFF